MRNEGTASGDFVARAITQDPVSGASLEIPVQISRAQRVVSYPRGSAAPSAGPAPKGSATVKARKQNSLANLLRGTGTTAYAISANLSTFAEELSSFDLTTPGSFHLIAGTGDPKYFSGDFGPDGNLYVPSFNNHKIVRYNGTTGAFMDDFVPGNFIVNGGLTQPRTLIFHTDNRLYVTSDSGDKVLRYNSSTGAFIDTFVPAGSGSLDGASGMSFGPGGALYVSSWRNDKILRYNGITGAFIDVFVEAPSGGIDAPTAIRFGPSPIPAVSEWGLATLGMTMIAAGTIVLRRSRSRPAPG